MEATLLQTILFWLFAVLGIAGGVGLIFNRNAVYAALSLIINFFSIAGLYLTLSAEFLAVIQILVYAGAIMVLFLFVIMLLNLDDEQGLEHFDLRRGFAFILGLGLVAELMFVFRELGTQSVSADEVFTYGKVEPIGQMLMTEFLFPFEMISVVLLVALIGAIVIARKHTYSEA